MSDTVGNVVELGRYRERRALRAAAAYALVLLAFGGALDWLVGVIDPVPDDVDESETA